MIKNRSNGPRQFSGSRNLNEQVTTRIALALYREWSRKGLGNVSMEGVARRAKVGKAALYRRWPSRSMLIAEVVSRFVIEQSGPIDTNTLSSDLMQMLADTHRLMSRKVVSQLIPDLLAAAQYDDELSQNFRQKIQHMRRERGARILERAIARGELCAHVDIELALDFMPAIIYWRTVVNEQPIDQERLNSIHRATLAALLEL